MNDKYTVITDNGGGPNQIYHDIAGEIYTFPPMYRNKLTPGTQVIYHRAKKKKDDENILGRMSDESHYFGIAEIENVSSTNDGNLRATIKNYKQFMYPVMIHRLDGEYYEYKPFFQQGVRGTTKEIYDDICAASTIKSIPNSPKTPSKRGIKTYTSLEEGLKSNPFCKGKYMVVTGRGGYFLKNLSDGIYYELGKVKGFNYKVGTLKVLAQKPKTEGAPLSFLIRNETASSISDIGFLDPITNGLRFSGKIDGQNVRVNILM